MLKKMLGIDQIGAISTNDSAKDLRTKEESGQSGDCQEGENRG